MALEIREMCSFLKKWWKLIVGFLGAIALIFFRYKSNSDHKKFHKNSKQNLEAQAEAEKNASEKIEAARDKIDKDHDESMQKLEDKITKKKENLSLEIEKEEKRIEESSTAKAIADMFDAEHVKVEE